MRWAIAWGRDETAFLPPPPLPSYPSLPPSPPPYLQHQSLQPNIIPDVLRQRLDGVRRGHDNGELGQAQQCLIKGGD